jgi:outer membrane protein assembly factor BamE (lipoprotein component of BamABCDE complex)
MAPAASAWVPGVYRIDIAQGNIVTQEMIDQLKPN